MNLDCVTERVALTQTRAQMKIFFFNFIFGQRKELPAGSGSYPIRRHLIASGQATGRVRTAMMSPVTRLLDLRSALPTRNKPSCRRAETGVFGSQNRLSGQLHEKHTRNTLPYLPSPHSRFRKWMEGWRFSLKSKSKTKCRTDSRNSTRTWSGVRTTFTGCKC